ncbi:DUF456 domain-containing protein [Arthrobacter sp. H14-L1]|uniref:DUF456 domain-containing protein n=1 Tax=Arthrobacter sp. H14-L1 TaxID=2996697 RepID=UPI002270C740|nr:DUF456 domain-containing protein [Arthrobacter sp. H14-L1]MCY0905039.1 DUF456 domain-containing protein [Arthrobacter sp. H14-L1]
MDARLLWTIICGLLILLGAVGVVVPVLPGSILIALSLLAWAIAVSSPVGWVVFGIGLLLVTAGMVSSAVLTGRAMRRRQIPGSSILAGLALGIVGFFAIPVVGLLIGFALGLFGSELARQRSFAAACSSSTAALKATGLGVLAEFGFASLAGGTWIIGVWVYFANH